MRGLGLQWSFLWFAGIRHPGWLTISYIDHRVNQHSPFYLSRLILCTSWSWKMFFMSSWPSELAHNLIYCKHLVLGGEWVLDDLLKKIPALYECLLTDVIYVTFICSNIFSFHSFSFLFFFLSFKWGEEFDYEHCVSISHHLAGIQKNKVLAKFSLANHMFLPQDHAFYLPRYLWMMNSIIISSFMNTPI